MEVYITLGFLIEDLLGLAVLKEDEVIIGLMGVRDNITRTINDWYKQQNERKDEKEEKS